MVRESCQVRCVVPKQHPTLHGRSDKSLDGFSKSRRHGERIIIHRGQNSTETSWFSIGAASDDLPNCTRELNDGLANGKVEGSRLVIQMVRILLIPQPLPE